jgi:erythromycin esterase
MRAVWQHLADRREEYVLRFPAEKVDWAIQNAKVSEQATYMPISGSGYRDQCMAENLDWILQQNPGAKVVVWAHDAHISKSGGAMGSWLGDRHGSDYLAVGQIFHQGKYNAVSSTGLKANDAVPSFPGTLEYAFHSSGMPKFILDLRRASPEDSAASWLFGPVQYRMIGALQADGFLFASQLTADYDALVFFDQVQASTLLPSK